MNPNTEKSLKAKLVHYGLVLSVVCLASGTGLTLLHESAKETIRQKEIAVFMANLAQTLGQAEDVQALIECPDESLLPKEATIVGRREGAACEAGMPPGAFFNAYSDAYYKSLGKRVQPEDAVFLARTAAGVRYAAFGSAQGYQSRIVVLAAVDAPNDGSIGEDPVIYRVAVVSSNETPGLGENIKKVATDVSLWAVLAHPKGSAPAGPPRYEFLGQFEGKRLVELEIDKSGEKGGIVPVTGATISSRATVRAVRSAVQKIIEVANR